MWKRHFSRVGEITWNKWLEIGNLTRFEMLRENISPLMLHRLEGKATSLCACVLMCVCLCVKGGVFNRITGMMCRIMVMNRHGESVFATYEPFIQARRIHASILHFKRIIPLPHRQWGMQKYTHHKDLLWHLIWVAFSCYRWAFLHLHFNQNHT